MYTEFLRGCGSRGGRLDDFAKCGATEEIVWWLKEIVGMPKVFGRIGAKFYAAGSVLGRYIFM